MGKQEDMMKKMAEEHQKLTSNIRKIVKEDKRYDESAYHFVNHAVKHTVEKIAKENRHVTGGELVDGIAELAKKEFGLLSKEVLENWGIENSTAIGNIVYNMIEKQLLSKTPEDSIEDFKAYEKYPDLFTSRFKIESKKETPPIII